MIRTKRFPVLIAILAAGLVVAPESRGDTTATANEGQIANAVARLLEQGHFTRQKLNSELSRELLENYLDSLDYNRLYFLGGDIEEFRGKYGENLNDLIARSDISPAFEIFSRFRERVEDRVEKNLALAETEFTFDSDRTVEITRRESEWPADMEEADLLWRNRIEAELLQEALNENRIDEPVVVVQRRYNQVLRNVREQESEDIMKGFLSALAQTYDPHSDYLSPADMENFRISMGLSLVGVGAVLRADEGYARVVEVVSGGPADQDGRLQVNDRIAAVAQGDDEFEDVVGMKLDRVVERIRGQQGTIVRLLVVPGDAVDPSERSIIEITRDEVQLKDAAARAEIIDLPAEGDAPESRIGWIALPSFYSDMSRGPGNGARSTTEDVTRLLERLMAEGIEGLVIDLRRDGGGSLEEAIRLTGLFIPKGPVLQSKDNNGRIVENRDDSGTVLYDGPLVVLMNRLSASASEIFAAALQDYDRAVIVGDERSFGKGTVQQMIDVGRFMPFFSSAAANAGSLKLTVAKFYRVSGGSTQLNGVESDIILPSPFDNPEIGESALNNPLPYDEVPAARNFQPQPVVPLFLNELRRRSALRVAGEPEFQYTIEDMDRLRERIDRNMLSLNMANRRAEVEAERERREQRMEARRERGPALDAVAYDVTLENVDEEALEKVAFDRERNHRRMRMLDEYEEADEEKDDFVPPDAIRNETLRIIRDMIGLVSGAKTAKAQG